MSVAIFSDAALAASKIGNFGALRDAVHSTMGRDDIPLHVYSLVTAQLNQNLRVLEMIQIAALQAATEIALPVDFIEVESAYLNYNGHKWPLTPVGASNLSDGSAVSGAPTFFAVSNGLLQLSPPPDGDYSIDLRYYARLSDFTLDSSTTAVLVAHPGVYLYSALVHASAWAQDETLANQYAQLLALEIGALNKSDVRRRLGPAIKHKMGRRF